MNRLALLSSAAALALAILYVEFRQPAPAPPPAPRPAPSGPGAPEYDALLEKLAALERRLDARLAGAPAVPADPAATGTRAPGPGPAEAPGAGSADRARAVEEILARLATGRLSEQEMDTLWELLPGSGKEDAAIAALKAYAQANAGDADAWYGLGAALTAKLLGGKVSFMEQGSLSMQADAAFTKALAADESHFGARYARAVSYTFWPDAYGKGPDAIRDFEYLREHRRGDTSLSSMEDVYLKLAGQYRKAGDPTKAEAALREGLTYFPDSAELKKQLEALPGK